LRGCCRNKTLTSYLPAGGGGEVEVLCRAKHGPPRRGKEEKPSGRFLFGDEGEGEKKGGRENNTHAMLVLDRRTTIAGGKQEGEHFFTTCKKGRRKKKGLCRTFEGISLAPGRKKKKTPPLHYPEGGGGGGEKRRSCDPASRAPGKEQRGERKTSPSSIYLANSKKRGKGGKK